jgi:hypothetical protein
VDEEPRRNRPRGRGKRRDLFENSFTSFQKTFGARVRQSAIRCVCTRHPRRYGAQHREAPSDIGESALSALIQEFAEECLRSLDSRRMQLRGSPSAGGV